MKVLYLPMPRTPEPWRADFRHALSHNHEFVEFDAGISFADQVTDTDVVVSAGWPIEPDWVDQAAGASLRLWQVMSVGTDSIPLEQFWARSVPVANTPGPLSAVSVAEHALLLILACTRQLTRASSDLRKGRFWATLGSELAGKSLGIVGLGASGSRLARIARCLEMRVLGFDTRPEAVHRAGDVDISPHLADLLERSDFVSLHVPLTPETRRMIGAQELQMMKKTAYVINVARGGVVDEAALVAALRSQEIAGAGLDVFDQEPLPTDHPFRTLPNVVLTPHIAGVTLEVSERRALAAATNIDLVAEGKPPNYLLTPHAPTLGSKE